MSNKRQLDDIFKQQQHNQERPLSDDVWKKLEQRLEERKPKRKSLPLLPQIMTIAAVLLLTLLPVAYYMVVLSPKQEKKMAQADANHTSFEQTSGNDSLLIDTSGNTSNTTAFTTNQETDTGNMMAESMTTDPKIDDVLAKKESLQKNLPNKETNNDKIELPSPITAPKKQSKPSSTPQKQHTSGESVAVETQMEDNKKDNATTIVSPANIPAPSVPISDDFVATKSRKQTSTKPIKENNHALDMGRTRGVTSTSPIKEEKGTNSVIRLTFETGNALGFIAGLQQMVNNSPVQVTTVPVGTISKADVTALMSLLDSQEPAAATYRSNQTLPKATIVSTVGNEAYWLIKSYKERTSYPPKLSVKVTTNNQVKYYNDAAEIKKLRSWWEKH